MSLFFRDWLPGDIAEGMNKREADARVRQLFDDHRRSVVKALAYYGVVPNDQPDLLQDVFLAVNGALLAGNHPVAGAHAQVWRAWLREFARRFASNYRRKVRLTTVPLDEPLRSDRPDPERTFARRELLILLVESLDDEHRDMFLDVSASDLSWAEVAGERGITIDQARYLHKVAMAQMEQALARWEKSEREPAVVPVSIADLLAAAPLIGVIPDVLHPRVFDVLARRAGASIGPRNVGRWAGLATRLPASAGLFVAGGVAGFLLRGPIGEASPAASLSAPTPIAVLAPETTHPPSSEIPAPDATATTSPLRSSPSGARQSSVSERRSPGATEDEQLLDQAQAALNAGDVHAALAVLSKRAGHFAGGPSASVRQRLLLRACALPGGRAEPECADGGAL
jgi:DNA-directed RNA polymerase specialized sigma24 family protein